MLPWCSLAPLFPVLRVSYCDGRDTEEQPSTHGLTRENGQKKKCRNAATRIALAMVPMLHRSYLVKQVMVNSHLRHTPSICSLSFPIPLGQKKKEKAAAAWQDEIRTMLMIIAQWAQGNQLGERATAQPNKHCGGVRKRNGGRTSWCPCPGPLVSGDPVRRGKREEREKERQKIVVYTIQMV